MRETEILNDNYLMDTGAISFSLNNLVSNEFRVNAHFDCQLNLKILQQALDLTILRYPMYNVKYIKGKGCVKKIKLDSQKIILEPYVHNFQPFDIFSDAPKLRVYYGDKFLSVEMYHTLSDGNGCLSFLNTLIACYFTLIGESFSAEGITTYNSPILAQEFEDGYSRFAAKGKSILNDLPIKPAYQLKGKPLGENENYLTRLTFLTQDLKSIKNQYNATVHEFFVASMFMTYLQMRNKLKGKGLIRLQMPVNMRTKFKTPTKRNFVGLALFTSKSTTFEDVLKDIKSFLSVATSEKDSSAFLYHGKTFIGNILPKLPSALGKFCVSIGDSIIGDNNFSTNLSNLGVIKNDLPHIVGYDFLLAPPKCAPFCMSSCSYKDKSWLFVTKRTNSEAFLHDFLEFIKQKGLSPIEISDK